MRAQLADQNYAYHHLAFWPARNAQDPKQAMQEKVKAVKESMAQNQAALRQYSWTARTEISLKGEVKKTTESLCRYGPDGAVQKTPVAAPAAPAQAEPQGRKKRGGGAVKNKIVENKKDEMQEYMERAVALIHNYVPPSAEKIQAAAGAGNAALVPSGADQVQVKFSNYLKPGRLHGADARQSRQSPAPGQRGQLSGRPEGYGGVEGGLHGPACRTQLPRNHDVDRGGEEDSSRNPKPELSEDRTVRPNFN